MTCSRILAKQGKAYPRTCAVHGLACPDPTTPTPVSYVERYAAAAGQVDRQWIVDEILQHDDGPDNAVHRVLAEAAELLVRCREYEAGVGL